VGQDRAVGPNGAGRTTTHLVARATDTGATSGVPTGGGAAAAAVLVTVFGPTLFGWQTELLTQPAVWTVPLAFTVMVVGSLLTRGRVPADVARRCWRLHAPGVALKKL
jgi:cation/acetate symporter